MSNDPRSDERMRLGRRQLQLQPWRRAASRRAEDRARARAREREQTTTTATRPRSVALALELARHHHCVTIASFDACFGALLHAKLSSRYLQTPARDILRPPVKERAKERSALARMRAGFLPVFIDIFFEILFDRDGRCLPLSLNSRRRPFSLSFSLPSKHQ